MCRWVHVGECVGGCMWMGGDVGAYERACACDFHVLRLCLSHDKFKIEKLH